MKIAVFSDSHGNIHNMSWVLKKIHKSIEAVIHLGDGYEDISQIDYLYEDIKFYRTPGNCDFHSDNSPFKIIEIKNKKILITHGHKYNVKSSLLPISLLAKEQAVDVCLFGHTHIAGIVCEGDIIVMNPGSIQIPKCGVYPTYGIIDITENGEISANIVSMNW